MSEMDFCHIHKSDQRKNSYLFKKKSSLSKSFYQVVTGMYIRRENVKAVNSDLATQKQNKNGNTDATYSF